MVYSAVVSRRHYLCLYYLQITKKLAGDAKGTSNWCTNIGNEFGQVLISVFTVNKGIGLEPLITGIVERYVTQFLVVHTAYINIGNVAQ